MNVLEDKRAPERRVAVCSINDCCPFRTNLCHFAGGCHGSISGRKISNSEGYAMLTLDDETLVVENGTATIYLNPPETAGLYRAFDSGIDSEKLAGQYAFNAVPEGDQPGRLKQALAMEQVTF